MAETVIIRAGFTGISCEQENVSHVPQSQYEFHEMIYLSKEVVNLSK